MIVPMKKYDIVLFSGRKDDFLGKLQDLGLVDITTTGWEPDEREREIMISLEKHRTAVARLKAMAKDDDFKPGKPYRNGEEAFEEYQKASAAEDDLTSRIAQARREVDELRIWGDFRPKELAELERNGVHLRYFSVYAKEFETQREAWDGQYNIVPITQAEDNTYFVVITAPGEEVTINAQEVRPPATTSDEKEKEIKKLEKEREQWAGDLARAAASVDLIEKHEATERERLQFSQVAHSGTEEAEGTLVIMEGWATRETEAKVDALLQEYPYLYYEKSDPTPEDDTPTLLKNNRFNRMFEIIGGFYSPPKYGTVDLTPYFGLFYALFFGLCLADAGYGLLYFIAGLVMRGKLKSDMRNIANLVTMLGFSTMLCGTLMDSFFGLKLTGWAPLAGLQKYLIGDQMFYIALALGIVQILLAMIIKAVVTARRFGLKYALSTIGWILALYSSLIYFAGDNIMSTAVYIPCLAVGSFLMFFMNSPGKNPFINFGSGIWNLYNDITSFLSDFLSYIRLFAIGLSGGILASVFNQLAVGLSGNIPVVKQLFMVAILLVGHGINIFMSSISSFVHPMRLTFVEFYKNSGFEDTQRVFTPLKRNKKSE